MQASTMLHSFTGRTPGLPTPAIAAAATKAARATTTSIFHHQHHQPHHFSHLNHNHNHHYHHISRYTSTSRAHRPFPPTSSISPSRTPTQQHTRKMTGSITPLTRPLPPGTWDSHMHIVDPTQYPLSATAQYVPEPHTLSSARVFYDRLSIRNLVLVQPSIYGTDNSCMLDALRTLTPQHGRGVVELDPATVTDDTLRQWHALGVRGVRVNLVSVGRDVAGQSALRDLLSPYVAVVRRLGWVLQLYIPMRSVPDLEAVVEDLGAAGVRLCLDHFASPDLTGVREVVDPYRLDGFDALVRMLRKGDTWVKLSAQYRVSKREDLGDLEPLGKELIRVAPRRVVYATDWPHTRFEGVDSTPFIEMCYRWCKGDEGMRKDLFRRNAEVLWDVVGDDGGDVETNI